MILLSSCSWKPEKEVVTVDRIVKPTIAVVPRPRPVEFDELKVKVITEANVQEVIEEMKNNQGQFLVYALDPVTFKNLSSWYRRDKKIHTTTERYNYLL